VWMPIGNWDVLDGVYIGTTWCVRRRCCVTPNYTTIKIDTEFRNVGNAAYTMSHAAAEAWTRRLAAGRGHRYRLAAPSLQPDRGTGSGPDC